MNGDEFDALIKSMSRPVRDLPFHVVIQAMTGCRVEKLDPRAANDAALLARIKAAAKGAAHAIKANPILRPRPNEVGNDIEPFLKVALEQEGLHVTAPRSKNGAGKSVGYPDILVFDGAGRPTYVECKSFNADTAKTTMRSFYLSPSNDFKVCHDARHVLVSFEMSAVAVPGSRDSSYSPVSYKIADLHGLPCDVKYEFNSDNRRLYAEGLILAHGAV